MPCDQVLVYSVVTLDGLDRRILESVLRQLGFKGSIGRMTRGQDAVEVEPGRVRVSGPSSEVLIAEVKRAYAAAAVQKAAKMMGWQVRKVQSGLILERR